MTRAGQDAPSDDLTCRELVDLVTDYLEGALLPAERARFEAHLGTCLGCRTYLDQMRQIIRLTSKLREESISPEAQAEMLRAFRTWKRRALAPSA